MKDQTQLWPQTYEREMAGILALQSEVARKVAETLALKLLPAEQARLAIVQAYVKAGEYIRALAWLERAYEVRDPNLPYAFIGPGFEAIRSHPRFQALRHKMNLPE